MAANNYSSPADALFQSVEQSYNKTASEVDNLLRTMGTSRMARALSSSRAKGFDAYGNPTNKTAAAYLQQQGQGAFQQSILQDKNFQANQAVWSDQNRPIDERIKSFNDWKEAFTLNALPVYKAQMPNVDVDSAFKSFTQPIEKVLQTRNQAVNEGTGITSTLGNLIDYAGYGLDSALRGAKSQYLQQFGTAQEIADWAKERQALDVADFQKMTPYQQDQILRQGQGQGFIERSSGPNGSILNNMAGMIGGMVPAMAVGMGTGATLGTMVSPGVGTVGGALAGGLTFGAQNADAYVQSILNSNMSQPEKEAALGDNAMLLATGTGVLTGAAAPYAGRVANKVIVTPIATKLAQRAVAKATAKGGAEAGAEAAAKAVAKATNPSYARNVVSNAVENAGIMTANNMGVNASVNVGTGKPLTQDIMNGTGESIATAIALAPIFGAMHSWRRRPVNKPTDKTGKPTPTEPTPTKPIVDETTGVESTHPVESNIQSPEAVLQKTAADRAFQAVSNGTLTDTQWRLLQGLIDNDTFDFNNIDAAIQYVKENCPANGVDLANAQQESQSWFHNFMIGLRSATDRTDSAEVYNQWAKEHPEEATVRPFDQAQNTQESLKNDPAYAAQMAAMQDTSSFDNTQNNKQTPVQPQKRKWQLAKEKRQAKNKEPEQQASTEQTGTATQEQQASTEQTPTLAQKLDAYDKISADKRIALLAAAKSKNFTEEDIIAAAELLQDTPKGSVQKTLALARKQRLEAEQETMQQQEQQKSSLQRFRDGLKENLPNVLSETDPRYSEVYNKCDTYTLTQLTDNNSLTIGNMLELLQNNPEMTVAEAERQSGIAELAVVPYVEMFTLWEQQKLATTTEIQQVAQKLIQNPSGDPAELLVEVRNAKTAEDESNTGHANPDSRVAAHPKGDTKPNPSGDTAKTLENSGADASGRNGGTPFSVNGQAKTPNSTPQGEGANPTEITEQNGGNNRKSTPTSTSTSEGTGEPTSPSDRSPSNDGNGTDASGGETGVKTGVKTGDNTNVQSEAQKKAEANADADAEVKQKAEANADADAEAKQKAEADAETNEKLTEVKVGQTPQDRLVEISGATNMKTEAKLAYVLFGKSGGKKTAQELPEDTHVSEDGTYFITEDGIVGKFNTDTNEVVCTASDGSEVARIPAKKTGFDNMLKRITDRQGKKNDVTVIRNEDTSDVAVFAPSIYKEDPEGFVRGFYNDPAYVESVSFDNTKRGNDCSIKFRGIKDPVKLTYRNREIYFIHNGKKVVIEKNVDGRRAFDFVTKIGNNINKAAMDNLRDYHSAGRTLRLDDRIGEDDGSRTVGEQIADTTQQIDPFEFEDHKKQIKATLKKILPESKLGDLYEALDEARTENDLLDVEQQAVEALSLTQRAKYAKDLFENTPDKDITDYINNIENSGFDLGDYDVVSVERQKTSDGRTDRQNFTFTIQNQDTGAETKVAIKVGMKNGKFVPKQEGADGKFYTRQEFDEQGIEPKAPLIIGDTSYDTVSRFAQITEALLSNKENFDFNSLGTTIKFNPIFRKSVVGLNGMLHQYPEEKRIQDIIEKFSAILHWSTAAKPNDKQKILLFDNAEQARKAGFTQASDIANGQYFPGGTKKSGGTVLIYRDHVKSVEQLLGTLVHETLVHAGLHRYFGEYAADALLESYKTWTAEEKKAFKDWLKDPNNGYPDRLRTDVVFESTSKANKATLLEEYIARNYASLLHEYQTPSLYRGVAKLLNGYIARLFTFLENAVAKAIGIKLEKNQNLFDISTAHNLVGSLFRLATEGPGWNKTAEAELMKQMFHSPEIVKAIDKGLFPETDNDYVQRKLASARQMIETLGVPEQTVLDSMEQNYEAIPDETVMRNIRRNYNKNTKQLSLQDHNAIATVIEQLDKYNPEHKIAVDDPAFIYVVMDALQDAYKYSEKTSSEFLQWVIKNPEEFMKWYGELRNNRDAYQIYHNIDEAVDRDALAKSFDDIVSDNNETSPTPAQEFVKAFETKNNIDEALHTPIQLNIDNGNVNMSKPVITRLKKLANGVIEAEEIELKGRARDLFDNTQVRDNSLWLDWTTKIANTLKDSHAKINQFFATYFDDSTKSLARNPLVSLLNLVPARIQGARNELLKPLEDIRNSMKETAQRLGMSLEDTLELAGMWATARHSEEANAHQLELYDEQIARYEALMQEKKIDPHAQGLSPRKQKIVKKWNDMKTKKMHLEMILDRVRDPNDKDYADVQHIRTGTGLTNAEAKKVMQDILTKGFTEDELNAFSDKLSAYHRDIVQDFAKRNKLVPEDNKLPNFQHYVPATKRLESTYFADNDAVPLLNMGDLYSRSGRDTVADNGWTSTLDAVRRISSQAGYADFSHAFLAAACVQEARFGKDDPRNGFVITKYADKMGNLLTGSGAERYDSMNFIKKGGFVCKDPETGERLIVRFKQNGWADPTTGLTGEQLNESLTATPRMDNAFGKAMTTTTGWFGQALTRLKPLFAPANMTRDTFERSFAIAGDSYQLDNGTVINGPKLAMKFLYNMSTGRIGKMFFDALMGRDNPKAKQYYDEYVKLGGKQDLSTMGIIDRPDILNTKDTKPEAVQKMLSKVQQQCPELYKILGEATPDVAAKALNMLDHWNDYFNSMAGFGQYVTMREAGISEKAAVNATLEFMNLNQTGTATPVLRCLYPFVKPTIQGGAAMMRSLGFAYDPRGFWHPARLKSYGYILGAFAAAAVIKGLVEDSFGTDENGNKKIDAMSMDQLSSYIPLPIGDNEYLRLNIGFGLPQVVMTTLYGMDRVQRGLMSPGDVAARIMLTSLKNLSPGNWPSFNPSENPTAYVMQTLTPTFFRPFVEVATNTSYSGNTLVFPSANRGVSKAYSGGARAMKVYHNMAKTIFDYTGLDLAPEQVQNIASNLFVGPFGFIKDLWEKNDPGKTSTNLYKDSHLDPILYTIGASMHIGKMPNNEQQLFYLQDDKYNKLMREKHIDLTKHPNGLTGSDLTDWQRKALEDTGLSDKDISNILILNAARRAMQGKTKEINTLLRAGILSKEDNDRLIELFNQLDEFKQSVYVSTLEALE